MAPGWFGYSVIRNSVGAEFYRQMLAMCETMDFGIEGLHEETGPGVIEAAIGYDGALAATDKAALFKTFIKVLAQRNAMMATFMAKWSRDWPGQSGHIHLSLRSRDGKPVFHDPASLRRRPAAADAGAAGDDLADRQLLHAADPWILGADRRDGRRRESHL